MAVVYGTTLRPGEEPLASLAGHLARRLGVPLWLVHVCEDPRARFLLGAAEDRWLGDARQTLEEQAKRIAGQTGASVTPHLAAGPVVTALSTLAGLEQAKVVLVGSSTRRFRRIAERLCRVCPSPVLVLRQAERLAAWLRKERPLRILVGTDHGRAAEQARRLAVELSKLGDVSTEVLSVVSPAELEPRLDLAPRASRPELPQEEEAALLRELSVSAPPGESATLRVEKSGSAAGAALLERTAKQDFDLVLLGRRRRTLVDRAVESSVAASVMLGSPVSVVCVPPGLEPDRSFRAAEVVVVGLELSSLDPRVVAHARGYAAEGAAVHLVHVLDGATPGVDLGAEREDAWCRLQELAAEGEARPSLTFEQHVLEGPSSEELMAFATRAAADLVVIGAPRRSMLERVVRGSVARSLLEDARVPVLMVPERGP